MPAPFIIISNWEVKEGKVDELKRFQRELSEIIEAKEPQLIAFNPKNIAYFGTPPESLQASIAGRGDDLTTMPVHIAGFTRSSVDRKG